MEIELRSKWVYVHKWNFLWDFDLKLVYCKGIIWHYRLFIIYSCWRDLCTLYQLQDLIILSSKQPRYSSDKPVFLVIILDLSFFVVFLRFFVIIFGYSCLSLLFSVSFFASKHTVIYFVPGECIFLVERVSFCYNWKNTLIQCSCSYALRWMTVGLWVEIIWTREG